MSKIDLYLLQNFSNANAFTRGMNDVEARVIWLALKSGLKQGAFDSDKDAGFAKHTAVRMWRELNNIFGES